LHSPEINQDRPVISFPVDNVVGFDVTMNNVTGMQIAENLQQAADDGFDSLTLEWPPCSDYLTERLPVNQLLHEIELLVFDEIGIEFRNLAVCFPDSFQNRCFTREPLLETRQQIRISVNRLKLLDDA